MIIVLSISILIITNLKMSHSIKQYSPPTTWSGKLIIIFRRWFLCSLFLFLSFNWFECFEKWSLLGEDWVWVSGTDVKTGASLSSNWGGGETVSISPRPPPASLYRPPSDCTHTLSLHYKSVQCQIFYFIFSSNLKYVKYWRREFDYKCYA